MSDTIIQTAIICLTVVAVFYIMGKVMIAEYSINKKEVEQPKNNKENADNE